MNGIFYFMVGREIAKHRDKFNIKMPQLIVLTGIAYAVMLFRYLY